MRSRRWWWGLAPWFVACTSLRPGDDVIRATDMPPVSADDAGGGARGDAGGSQRDAQVAQVADSGVPCKPAGQRDTQVLDHLELSADSELSCAFDYEVEGFLVVSRGTLHIDEGVTIRVRRGGFVLVGAHARIDAQGSAAAPVVFTAAERPAQPGAWAGLFLLGLADTALANNSTIALPPGDTRAFYGGEDDAHDCGALRYVRVEFAGGAANDYDFPAAGLTFAGCGRSTVVDHVQVHAASDGIGLIGGTVPLKRVLVTAPRADGIEWAAGYRGFMQFVIVQSYYGAGAALKGSRSDADQTTPPASSPVIYNATLVGADAQGLASAPSDPSGFETGILLQAATEASVHNALVYGFAGPWVDVIGASTARLFGSKSQIANSVFADPSQRVRPGLPGAGVEPGDGEDDDGGYDENGSLRSANLHNRFPSGGLSMRDPFARPPARPSFSADAFVDGGNLADSAPPGFEDTWEAAYYAGALPRQPHVDDSALDFTLEGADGQAWTSFPEN